MECTIIPTADDGRESPPRRPSSSSSPTTNSTPLPRVAIGAAGAPLHNRNHGKRWTAEEDRLLDGPSAAAHTDAELAQMLRRSEQAVKNRRTVLAARMTMMVVQAPAAHNGKPPLTVSRAKDSLSNMRRGAGDSRPKSNTTNHRNFPKHATIIAPMPHTPLGSPPPFAGSNGGRHGTKGPGVGLMSAIGAVCGHIRGNNGRIDSVWAQEALVPTLVQFHAGFQAYAAYVAEQAGGAAG